MSLDLKKVGTIIFFFFFFAMAWFGHVPDSYTVLAATTIRGRCLFHSELRKWEVTI